MNRITTFLLAGLSVLSLSSFAETKVTEKIPDGEADSAVVIQKRKNVNLDRDFEIVDQADEITGEPETGWKAAYASWKKACAEWKTELKEANKGMLVGVPNCGRHEQLKDPSNNGVYTYRSQGKYKLNVPIRK